MDSILVQKQVRDNSEDLLNYIKDLKSWEEEMKRKEADMKAAGDTGEEIPPVRSKLKKKDETATNSDAKPVKRIPSHDYAAWEKFDVDAECDKVDTEKQSSSDEEPEEKSQLLRDEAVYEKEKGNKFVKNKQWDQAIACYTRAIECFDRDPIFYANRALCYLKNEQFKKAEVDCTTALQLDGTYVKALQRRAAARIALKQLTDAERDLKRVLEFEPHNSESKNELLKLEKVLGTKVKTIQSKTEKSKKPSVTNENRVVPALRDVSEEVKPSTSKQIVEKPDLFWPSGTDVHLVRAVNKSPHQRSKKPLRRVEVIETELGKICIENKPVETVKIPETITMKPSFEFSTPVSSVQFYKDWKIIEGDRKQKLQYLLNIPPERLPDIFQNSLESDILSDILEIFVEGSVDSELVYQYLLYIASVKRFSALVLFMSDKDKNNLKTLCRRFETQGIDRSNVNQLEQKYEM